MRKKLTRLTALIVAIALFAAAVPFSAMAETETETTGEGSLITSSDSGLMDYNDYLAQYGDAAYATENVYVDGDQGVYAPGFDEDGNELETTVTALAGVDSEGNKLVATDGSDASDRKALYWEGGRGSITYTFTVDQTGFYNFFMEYLPAETGVDIELAFTVDGAATSPFDGADTLSFGRDWINVTDEVRTDAKGNELAPEQTVTGRLVERTSTDDTGVAVDPFLFYFTKGEHTVTLTGTGHDLLISKVGLTAPEKTVSYDEYIKSHGEVVANENASTVVIQGEDAILKNDSSLVPKSTNGNVDMTPIDPYLTLINNIGGTSWQSPGQKITWEFEVAESGYYEFTTRYKQSDVVNGESYRWLKIDGETPFAEAKAVRYSYDTSWQEHSFGYENENEEATPYYIWLDAGKHTLSLEVTLAETAEAYDRLYDIVQTLGDMYLQIVMITSENPDINRDYELFRQIPTFTSTLEQAVKDLDALVLEMQTLTGELGSQYIAAMNNMARVLNQMLDAPYIAHIYVSDYYSNYTSLSSWLSEMKKMPVTIDEMRFVPVGQEPDFKESNFFESLWFEILRLVSSFVNDYNLYDENANDGVTLKMWVNWGRDQTMALNSLIQDSFTSNTGVNVNLQIVSASLINGLLADNFPDVQLHLSRTDPVNYGMRGALLDLTQFEDLDQVLTNFQKGAEEPYRYNGALYALPDTQTFFCMYYRTDVFEDLGLEVPTTWEEYLYCATIIQRYNMDVYVPYTQITTTTTVNAGIGSLHLYSSLMLQNGCNLYNDAQNATAISNVDAIQVFDEWTEMYTDYGYQKEADFYNRFRNGSMPLGIASYSVYMTISSAAPEIDGRWTIANVPGTIDENGNLNQTIAGAGSGAAIVAETSHPNEAWQFLKWWVSAETQARYSKNVESVIGVLGRIATANVEAFNSLSWDPDDLEALNTQWAQVQELPEVPGSYYLTRAVDQAFWSVLNDGTNAKDAINKWALVADNEIKRKIEEYS